MILIVYVIVHGCCFSGVIHDAGKEDRGERSERRRSLRK